MNILFLDSIEKETYGGMEEWIRLVATGLSARGHDVTIAGREDSSFLKRVTAKDVSGSISLLPLAISGDFNPVTIAKINQYIDQNEIEIVVANFNKDVRLGGLASRLNGQPRVIWSLGLDITSDKLLHRILTPKLVDGVLVPSMSLQAQVTRCGYIASELIEVIPIGIPDSGEECHADHKTTEWLRREYQINPSSLIATTSGRFVEQKGHKHLIDAAALLKKRQVNLTFLLLGDGPLEQELRKQMDHLNVTDMFRFVGMVPSVDKYLSGADMMVHPSIEEPFGIAILEGMRASLPVIASRVGGIPEVVREDETAFLVEKGNASSLATSIEKMAASPELRRRMGENGRKRWLAEFTLEVMIDRIERYFQKQRPERARQL